MATDETLIEAWLLDQRRRGLQPATIVRRRADLYAFSAALGRGRLCRCSSEDINEFLDGRDITSKTRYCWLSELHMFYRWAIQTGHTDTDPTDSIDRPRLRRTKPRPITDADLTKAFASAQPTIYLWLLLAAYGGLRCCEIARLRRDDVAHDSEVIHLVGKGKHERIVPLHPRIASALLEFPQPSSNKHIFRQGSGGPYSPARVSQIANAYLRSVGVASTMHQLRHWFATRAYAAEKDLRVVQELLGHQSPSTTAVYADWSKTAARSAVFKIRDPDSQQTLW